MIECLKDVQFLWAFFSGVIGALLLVYGKPFRVRGWLHLPGYGLALKARFDKEHPGCLIVRITNTGSKPITPESFKLVTSLDAVELPHYLAWLSKWGSKTSTLELQSFSPNTDVKICQPIESLHHADVVLASPTYDTFRYAWAANIKQIYLLDSVGYRWKLSRTELDSALRDCREYHAKILEQLKENAQGALYRRSSSILAETNSAEQENDHAP